MEQTLNTKTCELWHFENEDNADYVREATVVEPFRERMKMLSGAGWFTLYNKLEVEFFPNLERKYPNM